MRSKTAQWFECRIKYQKVMEDGLMKQVTEQYSIDALSYAEAENRIIEEMRQYISNDFEVTDIKKAAYKEVFFDEGDNCSDRYYRAKLAFITLDEKTEKEKSTSVTYCVQANSFKHAFDNLTSVMKGTMFDYSVISLAETKLIDVFVYEQMNVGKENE